MGIEALEKRSLSSAVEACVTQKPMLGLEISVSKSSVALDVEARRCIAKLDIGWEEIPSKELNGEQKHPPRK